MLYRVALLHDPEEAVPVCHCLRLHQVVLVGERPPHVSVRGQPGHDVLQIAVVRLRVHRLVSPAVVRVKENQIRLDSQIAQLTYPRLEVLEVGRIEARVIPSLLDTTLERMVLRFVLAVTVVLREHAHPDLVEWTLTQRCERLLLHLVALMIPGVAGRADLSVWRPVGVLEVIRIGHPNRTVVPL